MTSAAAASFADTKDPIGRLNPPKNFDGLVTDSVLDALPVPVDLVVEAIEWATGFNLIRWATEAFGGDWGVLLTLADMYNNLHWAAQDIATNITRGLTELNAYWTGNAAQAFDAHMAKWYGAVSQFSSICGTLRDTFKELATVAKEFLQIFVDLLELIGAIFLGGGIVGVLVNGFKIGETIVAAYKFYRLVIKSVQAAVSLCQGIATDRPDGMPGTKVDIPSTGYSGPMSPGAM